MSRWRFPVITSLALTVLSASIDAQQPAKSLAFTNVTVVDVEAGQLVPGQTVVIKGNRIAAVGKAADVKLPANTKVVRADGKYLMPGLWDMHVHVREHAALLYPVFVATGVTGIREMDQPLGLDRTIRQRREIEAGRRVGPRVLATGPFIETQEDLDAAANTPGPKVTASIIATPAEAVQLVDSFKKGGADHIKVHSRTLSRETYLALLAEARRVGIPVVGHIPGPTLPLAEALDSGQRSTEHPLIRECRLPGSAANFAATDSLPTLTPECEATLAAFQRNGAWFTPTLSLIAGWLGRSTSYGRIWPKAVEEVSPVSVIGKDNVEKLFSNSQRLTAALYRRGVPMLAGTDLMPGGRQSVHDELVQLVQIGLTPAEALRTATLNPARYLNATDSLGTVAAGKLADLVLLDADPLTDVGNTNKLQAVVANGRYFDRAALDRVLVAPERAVVP